VKTSPDLRVIVIDGGPHLQTRTMMATAILNELGKSSSVTGGTDHASDDVVWAITWLNAHDTQLLIVTDSQTCGQNALLAGSMMAIQSQARLCFLTDHHPHPELQNLVEGLGGASTPDLPLETGDQGHAPVSADERVRVDHLPADDWPTFLDTCRAALPTGGFERIHAAYRHGFSIALDVVIKGSETTAIESICSAIVSLPLSAPERIATLRGAQAGAFSRGWNVRVDVAAALRNLARGDESRLSPDDYISLRAYRDTARPAACVLWDLGNSVDDIGSITVDQTRQAVLSGNWNGQPILDGAATYLRAHLFSRASAPDQAPFIDESPPQILRILRRAARDIGIRFVTQATPRSRHTNAIWHLRSGILVAPIAPRTTA